MAPGRDQAYDAEPLSCHACAAKERAERAHNESGVTRLPGLRWRIFER